MAATVQNFKQRAHQLVDQLADNAGWNDLAYEVSIIQDIEEGLRDSAADRVVSNADVRSMFGLPECE